MKTGKLLLCALFLLTGLSFASCSKDKDDDKGGTDSKIVGTWICSTDSSWSFTFNANGTFIEKYDEPGKGEDMEHGTYTFNDPTVMLRYSDGDTDYGTLSGNTFFLDDEPFYKR